MTTRPTAARPDSDRHPAAWTGEAWTRQPGETAKAYSVFCTYRDLGPRRSMKAAAAALGRGYPKQLYRWSSAHRWVERAQAWDEHLDDTGRAVMERRRVEMVDKHAEVAEAMLDLILLRLKGDVDAGVLNIDANALDPDDIPRWLSEASKVQRTALGLPTEITKIETGEDHDQTRSRVIDVLENEDGARAARAALRAVASGSRQSGRASDSDDAG